MGGHRAHKDKKRERRDQKGWGRRLYGAAPLEEVEEVEEVVPATLWWMAETPGNRWRWSLDQDVVVLAQGPGVLQRPDVVPQKKKI